MVIPPLGVRRQPVDVALDLATMALTHPGRVALGVGTGEGLNEKTATGVWPSARERSERIVEAIELIRKCWSSDDFFHHRGKYFDTFFYLYNKPSVAIPLYCAANGPIMAWHAGRLADGFCCVGVTSQYIREVLIPRFEQGAREAGKDPKKLEKIVYLMGVYHPDREKAFEMARIFGGVLKPESYDQYFDPRVLETLGEDVTDEALDAAFGVASDAMKIVAKFEEFIGAGCNHIIWSDISPDPTLTARVFRDEVLPYLRKRYSGGNGG